MCKPETRKGSVRAILSFLIVPPIIAGAIALMFFMFANEQYTSALGILSGLNGIAGSIVGYYFGSKSAEKANKEIVKAHDREIEKTERAFNMMSERV